MNSLSNNLTTTCGFLGILNYESSKSTVNFAYQCKDIFT